MSIQRYTEMGPTNMRETDDGPWVRWEDHDKLQRAAFSMQQALKGTGMSSLYLCEACAPEGLLVEEYATRPLVEKCFVCGEDAARWYTRADAVLKALLKEREKARAWISMHALHDESGGPCYGRLFAAPNPDQSVHTCRCGLDQLRKAFGIGK